MVPVGPSVVRRVELALLSPVGLRPSFGTDVAVLLGAVLVLLLLRVPVGVMVVPSLARVGVGTAPG